MPGDDDNKKLEDLQTAASGCGSGPPSLTTTPVLKSLVTGMPKSVIMRVVGKSGPYPTKTKTIFNVWLSNDGDSLNKMIAWEHSGDALALQLKLYSVVSFKYLQVLPIKLIGDEKNITSSDKQFLYDETNSRVVEVWPMLAAELENKPDYPPNPYPPFWKYFADIKQYDRHLAGRSVVLADFEEYTLELSEFRKMTYRKGIYGIAGDPKFKKVYFFVECDPSVVGPALSEFKKGDFFNYYEAKAMFKGDSLWVYCVYKWTSPMDIESKKTATEDNLFTFVTRLQATCSTPKVKSEATEHDDTPAKKISRSQF